MKNSQYSLCGVARAIPCVESFVTPIFLSDAGDHVVQIVEDGKIVDFASVLVGEEMQQFPSTVQLKVGDEAIFGFELVRDDFLVGTAHALAPILSENIINLLATLGRPRTCEAVKRFINFSEKIPSENIDRFARIFRFSGLLNWRQLTSFQSFLDVQSQEADAINVANQAAIVRLMHEMAAEAADDSESKPTIPVDITSAIADSVNYTVAELRSLMGNVQATATRVEQTTSDVESTSTELLAAATEQLREIREAGQSVLDMAQRINQVSGQAQESALVARTSLQATESGLQAVQDAIRDQIQETSKRFKRLGKSSQEIGEITELISDISEQTNVLALNAAIQAASAGDAGRGFSVVAEGMQRLAKRSADATRQIAALVKAIQIDTQDAVAAMERSTQGAVEGAKLPDNAGTALAKIDRVSRRLAELTEKISSATLSEAKQAAILADNIQHIFAVTEQAGEDTRSTAQRVQELSAIAKELSRSVARFKIA